MTIPPGRKNRDLPIRPLNQKGAETVLSEMLWQAVFAPDGCKRPDHRSITAPELSVYIGLRLPRTERR